MKANNDQTRTQRMLERGRGRAVQSAQFGSSIEPHRRLFISLPFTRNAGWQDQVPLVREGVEVSEKEMRELNLFTAERVMGWKRTECGPKFIDKPGYFADHGDILLPRGSGRSMSFWSPTTDPADAMMVLEKCAKLGAVRVVACTSFKNGLHEVWNLRVVKEHAEAETLPLAICLFAKQLFSAGPKSP